MLNLQSVTVKLINLRSCFTKRFTSCKFICCVILSLQDILIDAKNAVTSLSVNPLTPYQLAAGCKDRIVRVFDRRTLGTSISTRSVKRSRGWMPGLISSFKPDIKKEFSCRVTSLQYRYSELFCWFVQCLFFR